MNKYVQDLCDINDPLGQTHIPASSNLYSHMKLVCFVDFQKWGQMYGRTDSTGEITMIITGCDCGSASWINNL